MRNRLIALMIFLSCSVYAASAPAGGRLNLAGTWRVRLDPQDEGVGKGWFSSLPETGGTMDLPGTTDLAGLGAPETNPNPGYLSREHKYIGSAWYQRSVTVPEAWQGKDIQLFLERVLWESRVWIDGRECGQQDSLGTPHLHDLGRLAPGAHTLTLRIDNRMIHPIGDRGHCYTEFTQTKWNGAVGRLELRALPAKRLGRVRVFSDADARKVTVDAEFSGSTADALELTVSEAWSGKVVARGKGTSLSLQESPRLWDAFTPNLYRLEVTLGQESRTITFGFRTVASQGRQFLINGRPSFIRGNMDCAQYPRTGHPPMDVESWKRMYRICRQYGLNQVRFHSWCPPEAAFIAADEMGMYLQAEVLWIDGWMGRVSSRKDMDTPPYPKGVGRGDRTIDQYVRAEMRRMLDTYGNHPSFCFFVIGNELGSSNFKVMEEWIREAKTDDPRRLYAASAARTITPSDDFSDTHHIPGGGRCVNNLGVPHTDWDYEGAYKKATVPIIAHEAGQMPVYPDWREIEKYTTGPLRARNYELFREQARKHGIEAQSADFQRASGAMNRIIYKGEMEALLRTPSCAGISWLSLQDFPGQGEALVGWLDSFYDSKGIVTPEQFRHYSTTTVPLARFKKFVWTTEETFVATAEIAHWGAQARNGVEAQWRLQDASGDTVAQGVFPTTNLVVGSVTRLGEIRAKLADMTAPCRLKLEIALPGTEFRNDWNLWVYPVAATAAAPAGVTVTESPSEAWNALSKGGRVVFLAHRFGSPKHAAWMPLFWSARFFPGQNRDTLGALVQGDHPALAHFPTDDHLDWQWVKICDGARGFVLNDQSADYRPIVQPVSDYHFNDKLGTIFEFRTAAGGRLLVCGYNLVDQLEQRPAARQLRESLLTYAGGAEFAPDTEMSRAGLETFFPILDVAPIAKAPERFAKAMLYVRAGAHHPGRGDTSWSPEIDEAVIREGFSYKVSCNAVWKDDVGTAWWGAPRLRVEIGCNRPDLYDLYVHFHDWNENGRAGRITFEGRTYELRAHTGEGQWVKLDVMREDCLDNVLILDAMNTAGPNLQITAMALMPRD